MCRDGGQRVTGRGKLLFQGAQNIIRRKHGNVGSTAACGTRGQRSTNQTSGHSFGLLSGGTTRWLEPHTSRVTAPGPDPTLYPSIPQPPLALIALGAPNPRIPVSTHVNPLAVAFSWAPFLISSLHTPEVLRTRNYADFPQGTPVSIIRRGRRRSTLRQRTPRIQFISCRMLEP